eukprot:TRINITY_DN30507_c0_g1_i1.p1 TRINITY_DN30507_c0_g1~~TRINITY_DN30507_c0_g1_i1.p1  ORF type:complete len:710 (-),score=105.41 TRINITY_DN30507_c0_g1_i1:204-2333(-)
MVSKSLAFLISRAGWPAVGVVCCLTWYFIAQQVHVCSPTASGYDGDSFKNSISTKPTLERLRPSYSEACPGGRILMTLATDLKDEVLVPMVIGGLMAQTVTVDCIVVILNNYRQVPSHFPALASLVYHIPKTDLGASGNFFDRTFIERFSYHLGVDDGIIYPPDYAERMVKEVERHSGDKLVGVHCRNLSSVQSGALALFNQVIDYSRPIMQQLEWSPEVAEAIFAQHHAPKAPHHDVAESDYPFAGGSASVTATGTLAYSVERLSLTLDDVPPPGREADFKIALAARKKNMGVHCIARKKDWLWRIPRSGVSATGMHAGSLKNDEAVVPLMKLSLELDVLNTLATSGGRLSRGIRIARGTQWDSVTIDTGLLPTDCNVYSSSTQFRWLCQQVKLTETEPAQWLWQAKVSEDASQLVHERHELPSGDKSCKRVHVVVPFGGPATASAIGKAVMSVANQMYGCKMIWIVADKRSSTDDSYLYNRLMAASCDRSSGPEDPAFATVLGFSRDRVPLGCVNISASDATAAKGRGGPAYGKYAGYAVSTKYAKPDDIILTLDGDDQLIHPQALHIVVAAYVQRDCRCTWGSMLGRYSNQRGPLPAEAVVDGQARPRGAKWNYQHPRSFLAELFAHMSPADFQDEHGQWLFKVSDRGFIFRSIELAGPEHACYITFPYYGYYTDKPGGNTHLDVTPQRKKELMKYVAETQPSNHL